MAARRQTLILLGITVIAVFLALGRASANAQAVRGDNEETPGEARKGPPVRSLDEYLTGTDQISPLGVILREGEAQLASGAPIRGLLVAHVIDGSPANAAGLREPSQTAQNILVGAAVIAGFVFPPAMLAVPLVASLPQGRTGDLVIAVDASRVVNILDFEDQLVDAQPGEIVYLTIVRGGARLQIPVYIPKLPD
ncbi:MAG TPA: PDZ domain-containing protein [Candidatus Binataceae bacterium]|nr:PDZ domain-containing protein [Candidatus Binataceae bacterium]